MAQTISYNLDRLGWMQFESLIQVLLKAEVGMAVELWGGSADHGKDAYCSSELNFPTRHVTNPGPFIFQAKFITSANAAGANFDSLLISAVTKEVALIHNRIEEGKWKTPKHYVLLTNAPLTARHRTEVTTLLEAELKDCVITVQGATDICALLDTNISVARSFPQILSLRNLFEILHQVVRNDIVQRTDAVIKEADALSGVFVPTKAYFEAWDVLDKHSFVVLEGPPEMGKTAIAWIIAAVMLSRKWQAIDCDKPGDFFSAYQDDVEQVFIADDAFGETEYDVNRGSEWGRQLHKVIPKLNKRHWLIWTSRMHILQQALHEMSLQGAAAKFPDQKEILVKANKLDTSEKALMLYRHARAAEMDEDAKQIVRKYAELIIANKHFTPERIRRFVKEALPELLAQSILGEFSEEQWAESIQEAIENPTERMRKAYRKLDPLHQTVLIAMLDCERSPEIKELEISFRRLKEPRRPITEEIELLKEGFLQASLPHNALWRLAKYQDSDGVDWIHPSYRDLVIEELERDSHASEHFLEHCSWIGTKLALSLAGGDRGVRRYPLLRTDKSWDILCKRLVGLLKTEANSYRQREILNAVRTSLEGATEISEVHARLAGIIGSCCTTVRSLFDSRPDDLSIQLLQSYYDLSMSIAPPPPMPNFYSLWKTTQTEFETMLEAAEDGELIKEDSIADWINIAKIMLKTDRRPLIQDGYPEKHIDLVERLCDLSRSEAYNTLTFTSEKEASAAAERLSTIGTNLDEISEVFPEQGSLLRRTSALAQERSESIKEIYNNDADTTAPSWAASSKIQKPDSVDVARLFSDL
jgi:hypothetical protein